MKRKAPFFTASLEKSEIRKPSGLEPEAEVEEPVEKKDDKERNKNEPQTEAPAHSLVRPQEQQVL